MSETYVPGADEECPSRCEFTEVEQGDYGPFVYCTDCGSAGSLA